MDLDGWEYAVSARDQPYVLKEITDLKMSSTAIAKLEQAMVRVSEGTTSTGDVKSVRNGILELRIQADKRWYRMLFARLDANRVALLVIVKKTNRLEKKSIELAENRLREHKR